MIISKFKKVLAIAITVCTFASLLTGCGKTVVKDNKSSSPTVNTAKSDKPVEIRIFVQENTKSPWSNDMEVIKELSKKTNVQFKWEVGIAPNTKEKFNLIIATGDVPDIVIYEGSEIFKFAEKGLFEPLNDLIEKNAPNVKKIINSDSSIKADVTYIDGKIYLLPMVAADKVSEVFMLRKDWLDKLSIKEPETLDDWYNMLKAFKEKDPNGNGKADEIPFTSIGRSMVIPFAQSWGIQEDFFVENGKVKFGAIDERMKSVLEYLNKLYKGGLIDKEYITNDQKTSDSKIDNELAGSMHAWRTSMDAYSNRMKAANPKVDFQAVLPPKGPTGIQMTLRQKPKVRMSSSGAISSKSKYKTEIMKMYDYIYSEEGHKLMCFGIEGVHYNLADGKIKYLDSITKNPKYSVLTDSLFSIGANRDWPFEQDILNTVAFGTERYNRANALYNNVIKDPYPTLKFTSDQREIMNSKYTEINTYKDEMLDKFIMGAEPLSKFDDFVKKIKALGIDDVLKIHEDALKKYNEQVKK